MRGFDTVKRGESENEHQGAQKSKNQGQKSIFRFFYFFSIHPRPGGMRGAIKSKCTIRHYDSACTIRNVRIEKAGHVRFGILKNRMYDSVLRFKKTKHWRSRKILRFGLWQGTLLVGGLGGEALWDLEACQSPPRLSKALGLAKPPRRHLAPNHDTLANFRFR